MASPSKPTDSPTAGQNEVASATVSHESRLSDIDRQIAALHEQRNAVAIAMYPTFEEFARLPWRDAGAGVIRSASGACVVLIADADFAPDDVAAKIAARVKVSRLVTAACNTHHDLLAALREAIGWIDNSDPSGKFDRLAEEFYRETGYMRPGKAMPLEMGGGEDMEERRRSAWVTWIASKHADLLAQMRDTVAKAELNHGC